jgi:hypothetical protein
MWTNNSMIYQLTYELRTSDKDYTEFFAYIEQSIGDDAIHVLRDAWWISVKEKDLDSLCDDIRTRLGEKDVFFLTKIHSGETNGWMPQNTWKWYQKHIE